MPSLDESRLSELPSIHSVFDTHTCHWSFWDVILCYVINLIFNIYFFDYLRQKLCLKWPNANGNEAKGSITNWFWVQIRSYDIKKNTHPPTFDVIWRYLNPKSIFEWPLSNFCIFPNCFSLANNWKATKYNLYSKWGVTINNVETNFNSKKFCHKY